MRLDHGISVVRREREQRLAALENLRIRRGAPSATSFRFPVALPEGPHPFPFRTRKLSPPGPMVLRWQRRGRVGRCRGSFEMRGPAPPIADSQPAKAGRLLRSRDAQVVGHRCPIAHHRQARSHPAIFLRAASRERRTAEGRCADPISLTSAADWRSLVAARFDRTMSAIVSVWDGRHAGPAGVRHPIMTL